MRFAKSIRVPPWFAISIVMACACGSSSNTEPDAAPGFVSIVPNESADEDALVTMSDWRALPTFTDGRYLQQSSYDRGTGETFNISLLRDGNRDMNYFVCEGRNAFKYGNGLVPYEFDLDECPESWVRGYVIARFEGSGRLARLFMTLGTIRDGDPAGTTVLRIYIDDDQQPLVQVRLADAIDGSAGEIFAPPFGAGDPTHLAWYYPVVFSDRLIITVDEISAVELVYHQTDVVLDAVAQPRTGGSTRSPTRDAAVNLLGSLTTGPIAGLDVLSSQNIVLPPGVPIMTNLVGPGTIHELTLRVAEADLGSLADIDVTVDWDGGPPAIDLSLADLFATHMDTASHPSLALAAVTDVGSRTLSLRLPMPFATGATWTFTNRGAGSFTAELTMQGEASLPDEPWGHLHTIAQETVGPIAEPVHPVASLTGRGRLVGTCMMLEGFESVIDGSLASGLNFLEGDETIEIDGQLAVPGTGTEDYLNSSFYFSSGPFGDAFAQAWAIETNGAVSPETGRMSSCRWHVLGDAIDFATSIDFKLEVGPADAELLDHYRTVAFFYQ